MTDNLEYNHDPEKEDDNQKRRYYILPIVLSLYYRNAIFQLLNIL